MFLLIFTSFIANADIDLNNSDDSEKLTIFETINFSCFEAKNKDGFCTLETSSKKDFSYLIETGKPKLPVFIKTYTFLVGTKISDISIEHSKIDKEIIDYEIQASKGPISLDTLEKNNDYERITKKSSVYDSSELFPSEWFDYDISVGLDKGKRSIFLTFRFYPVRYSPKENTIYKISKVDLGITYKRDNVKKLVDETYDMVIITPEDFKPLLTKLKNHKNSFGIKTFIKTTEEIYDEFDGVDKPEQIKYFIKYALDNYGIKYVLLVGGLKSYWDADDKEDCNQGSKDWWLPVRYMNIYKGTISDLYYADIYESEDNFSSWDPNNNNVFADESECYDIDLYPDVYLGRLACRNKLEVRTVVNKIINYEKTPPSLKPWYNKMVAVGGLTYYTNEEGVPDAELDCNKALSYMPENFKKIRLYASHRYSLKPVPKTRNIILQFLAGAGFMLFQGHGSALWWDTNWVEGGYEDWVNGKMGFNVYYYPVLLNGRKLPIVVVGGCHNGLFNVTIMQTLEDNEEPWDHYAYGYPVHSCFCWRLVSKPFGGAIATTGCTGSGFLGISNLIEKNFFYEIGKNNAETVGEAFSGSINKYLNEYEIYELSIYGTMIYHLFGDPSLKMGGYERSFT